MCKAAQGDQVLDLTCGQGTAAITLARSGLNVTAFDRDAVTLDRARARASEETQETRDRLTLVTGDPAGLPLPDASFDSVLLADGFEQAGEAEVLLAEARRLLHARGRLVVTSQLEAPHAQDRPRASLSTLLALLSRSLRPVEVAEGDRWVGIVAVFGEPDAGSPEAWTALLEIAERRLGRLGDAYAERSVRLDETRERERELAGRVEELTSAAARLEQGRDDRDRRATESDERLAAATTELEDLRPRLTEAQGAIAETARRLADEERRRAELDASLAGERERVEALATRLGEEQSGRAGDRRRLDELEARLTTEQLRAGELERGLVDAAERVAEAELGLADATARVAEAELVREAADERVAWLEARTLAEREARDRRLSDLREDGRALWRETELSKQQARELEAELAAAREALLASRTELVAEARQAATLGERAGTLAARVEELERLVGEADGREREWRAEAGRREAELSAREAAAAARIAELGETVARGEERLAAAAAERRRLEDALAELDLAVGDRERRLADRDRQAIRHDRDAVARAQEAETQERELRAEIERLHGEGTRLRTQLAAVRDHGHELTLQQAELHGTVRTQAARLERLQLQLEREQARSTHRQARLDSLRAGRAYRWSVRWWSVRRTVRHPLSSRRKARELEPPPADE